MADALIGGMPKLRTPDPDAIGVTEEAPAVVPSLTEDELAVMTDTELQVYLAALEAQEERWDLTPRQKLAVRMTSVVKCLLYGGAAGGGKTELGLHHAYTRCQEVAGMRVLYLRTSFPELKRSAIDRALAKFDEHAAEYNRNDKVWRFPNGSRLEFGFLADDDDVYQYKSAEYDIIIMDEASEFTEFQWVYLMSRLRTTVTKRRAGSSPHMLLMTNPEGRGVAWLKRYFVLPTNYGEKTASYLMQPDQPDSEISVAFVPSKVTDNPYIDPDYRKSLTRLPEIKRRQLLEGDWDTFEGQFFPEFDDDVHVINPFPIPDDWERIRGLDHGWHDPTACVWIAFDHAGTAYLYKEYERSKTLPSEAAKQILEYDKEEDSHGRRLRPSIHRTMADSQMWAKTGANQFTIAQQFRQAGLLLSKANKARKDGWLRVREYLHVPDVPDAEPGLYVFSDCQRTINCLKGLVTNENDPDDCEKEDDHLADALRYALMSKRRRAVNLSRDPYAHLPAPAAAAARRIAELAGRRATSVNRTDRLL